TCRAEITGIRRPIAWTWILRPDLRSRRQEEAQKDQNCALHTEAIQQVAPCYLRRRTCEGIGEDLNSNTQSPISNLEHRFQNILISAGKGNCCRYRVKVVRNC